MKLLILLWLLVSVELQSATTNDVQFKIKNEGSQPAAFNYRLGIQNGAAGTYEFVVTAGRTEALRPNHSAKISVPSRPLQEGESYYIEVLNGCCEVLISEAL